eukprot:1994273-Rhodomonas_salina.1
MKEESERIRDSTTHLLHSLTSPTLEAGFLPCLLFVPSFPHVACLLSYSTCFVKCIGTMTCRKLSSPQQSYPSIFANTHSSGRPLPSILCHSFSSRSCASSALACTMPMLLLLMRLKITSSST